jgi:hypothetical protein
MLSLKAEFRMAGIGIGIGIDVDINVLRTTVVP